jgi:hypothetical protein
MLGIVKVVAFGVTSLNANRHREEGGRLAGI